VDRRAFLFRSASLFAGSLFGMRSLSWAFAFEEHENKDIVSPSIALIIDDIGYSFSRLRRFLKLEVPITFSILPRLPKSRILAIEIHSEGHEIMLHQPMEPHNPRCDPGPGALHVGDGPDTIVRIMEENISEMSFAAGVNNHMGSRFTECCTEVHEALSVVKNKGLFFVDSLTSSRSEAYKVAIRLGMVTARRNIFLDNVVNESAVLSQLQRLQRRAMRHGHAVGIGHPFPETAWAIRQFLRRVKHDNVTMVYVSDVLYT
jgi:polysaccharide deacetylase 2 family uncharacterized protein YibQ